MVARFFAVMFLLWAGCTVFAAEGDREFQPTVGQAGKDVVWVPTPQALVDAGLVKRKHLPIKILGTGELKKSLVIQAHKFSKSAEAKIQAAGGRAEVIPGV